MKRHLPKYISLLLAILFLFPTVGALIPVSAADYVKGSNSASDSYKSSIYYSRLTDVKLTGDGRTDVVAIALSQLGYQESNTSGEFSGLVGGTKNFTEYNYNFGKYNDDDGYGYYWCASFVSFCLLQARCHSYNKLTDWCRNHKGDAKYIWRELSCPQWATQLRTCGYFANSQSFGGKYLPIAGDLIFFTQNGTTESHIGIVLYSDDEHVYTVEGNTSDSAGLVSNGGGVYVKSYPLTSTYIRGYGILPYEVNNSAEKIDYSGALPTAGLYVATKNKYVYETETATDYKYLLPRFSMFTVTAVAGNGRLKGVFEIDGKTVTGYVKNNTDRIIQLTAAESYASYGAVSEMFGYKGSSFFYLYNNEGSSVPFYLPAANAGDTIGISGTLSFTREIEAIGFYLDGQHAGARFFPSKFDERFETAPGVRTLRYNFLITIPEIGHHSLTFVVRLMDGTVAEITTITYTAKGKYETPLAPLIDTVTETSVTLVHHAGYEYRMNDGRWQKSPTFTGLTPGTTYAFSRRLSESEDCHASDPSPALNVTTKKVPETTAPPETTTAPPETTTAPPETTTAPPETTTAPIETTIEPSVTTDAPTGETTEITPTESETVTDTASTTTAIPIVPSPDTDGAPEDTIAPPPTTEPVTGCSGMLPSIPLLAAAVIPAMMIVIRKKDEER